jgi:pteridine reductase
MGYDIALHFHTSESDAQKTRLEIEASGRRCFTIRKDLRDTVALNSLVPEVLQSLGGLDLLVNNASLFIRNDMTTATADAFDADFAIHVKAPLFLSQAFARECRRGSIINIIDSSVVRNKTEHFTYLLSKKGLLDLTKMSAKALAPSFRVNAIAPGIVLSPEGPDRTKYEALAIANPTKRAASPADVVLALEYLVRNQQVTGECLYVDGGDAIDY